MFTCTGKLFERELNFRGAQASLHPSRSSCCHFHSGRLYWEAEHLVFRKGIWAFWSFLWENNCSVTSLCFYIWGSLWERNYFFFEARKQCFLNEQRSHFQHAHLSPCSASYSSWFPFLFASLLQTKISMCVHTLLPYLSFSFWFKFNWPPGLQIKQSVFFYEPSDELAKLSLVPGIDRRA